MLKQELVAIADAIGPGESYKLLLEEAEDPVVVSLPFKLLYNCIPEDFINKDYPLTKAAFEGPVQLKIPHIFIQLQERKVMIPLEEISSVLPVGFLSEVGILGGDALIRIPSRYISQALGIC